MNYLIGIGNYSMFDDSIGIKIIEYIEEHEPDSDFQVIDLSANLINLLFYFSPQTTRIIIVDSAKMGLTAGEYRFFLPQQVCSTKKIAALSTHEGDLISILHLAQELGYHIPSISIMGIEPLLIKNEFGLSTILEDRIPLYSQQLINELEQPLAIEPN